MYGIVDIASIPEKTAALPVKSKIYKDIQNL
jgi:hypothetical protein